MSVLSVHLRFILLLLATLTPISLAGPACAHRQHRSANCMTKCAQRWGWPGHTYGTDPWGAVVAPSVPSSPAMPPKACASSVTSGGLSHGSNPPVNPADNPASTSSSTQISLAGVSTSTRHTQAAVASDTLKASPNPSPKSKSRVSPQHYTPSSPPVVATTHQAVNTPSPGPPPANDPSNPETSSSTSDSDIQKYLSSHNTVRAQHGAQPLTWNETLARKAQEWGSDCVFKHSGGTLGPFGENIAAGTGSGYTITDAVGDWAAEASQYKPNDPEPSHFTQIVWKGSTQLGCAVQTCGKGRIFSAASLFYVCEYSPQGNIIGYFPQNVQG